MSKGTIYSQPGSNVTLSCFITGVAPESVDTDADADSDNDAAPDNIPALSFVPSSISQCDQTH